MKAKWLAWAVAVAAGCSPQTEREREYFEARQQAREASEEFARRMMTTAEESELARMVQEAPVEDGAGTYQQWLDARLAAAEGSLLFSDWSAVRRGESEYEVRYEFTVMDRDYNIVKQGYSWTVNRTLRIVDPPVEMQAAPRSAGQRSTIAERRRRRQAAEAKFSLE